MDVIKKTVTVPDGTLDECGYITDMQEDFCLILNDLQLIPGKYVFSVWIKSSANGRISINDSSAETEIGWKKVIFYLEIDANEIIIRFQAGEYWLYNAKLEKGDKATDWTPSQEDVNELIYTAMKTADGKNTVYYQDEKPTAGEYKENDIWFDKSSGYKMYYYTNGEWIEAEFGTDAISANAITAEKLAVSAVTSGKIAAGAITSEKIAAESILALNIASGAIEADKISANAITAYHIAANAITGDKIAAETITSNLIASKTITGDKIAANTITATNIDVKDLIATGLIETNRLTAANINVNDLFAQNIIAAGTIQSANYSYASGQYSSHGLKFDMSTGAVTSKKFAIDVSGNAFFSGNLDAKSGTIGGWDIHTDSLSYGDEGEGGYMLLKPSDRTILTTGNYGRSLLTDGALKFERKINGQNVGYARFSSTFWTTKSDVYGVGVNSEADAKFISFGNKEINTDSEYKTVFLINYGLNPYKDADDPSKGERSEDVLIYGKTYFDGNICFNNDAYLGALTGGGIFCGGDLFINGKLSGMLTFSNGYSIMSNSLDSVPDGLKCDGRFKANVLSVGSTVNPGYALSIDGMGWINGNLIMGSNALIQVSYARSKVQSGAWIAGINTDGWIVTQSSSSRRYKNNIKYIDIETIKCLYDLPIYTFRYKDGYLNHGDERYDKDIPGFIAEDLEEVLPIAVNHDKGQPEMWNSNILIPCMLGLIQDLKKEISVLKQRIQQPLNM